ncbi:ferredoxin-type protein NapF [Neiella sp. HB171785]|uniref:Ferredoxin-type protein NapF n=1 Tax=Neiella litorisoli TaxID=2771431 RepID=A0A8J6R1V7_9GAMM|nr:ferredoxin-type protein NapF [Neiella litorisoli]
MFRGKANAPLVVRPPHALAESQFTETCTRCEKCIAVCPTNIIVKGSGGFPEIDFGAGAKECELCNKCVEACQDDALNAANEPVWRWQLTLNEQACLPFQGVACRSCGEYCADSAIRFQPKIGGQFTPELILEACTGCGACIHPCPTNALQIQPAD